MAPRLDLPPTAHGRIMVAPPRMNLRRAASYNNHERNNGPLSSTSSRFSFNHLLFSPPPSPSLPALVQPPKRRSSQIFATRPSRLLRRLFYLGGLFAIAYVLAFAFGNRQAITNVLPILSRPSYEMVRQDAFPRFPTPITVTDRRKRSKWTVSIPHDYDFPLTIKEYSGMTDRCRQVSAHARNLRLEDASPNQAVLSTGEPDNRYVDVEDAERTGLLPAADGGHPTRSGRFVGLNWESMAGRPVCRSSLTYVLESPDAGLGSSLMTMWTLYALAKKEGRAFFVDDSRWAYGAYTDIFQAPLLPDCRPPPRHHMVPCPMQARHLVVSGVTVKDALPALLARHNRHHGQVDTQRELLDLARTGYRDLFALVKEDEDYVDHRIKEIEAKAGKRDKKSVTAPVVGLHIRRGDRHPLEFQYRDTYIPTEIFASRAQSLAAAQINQTHAGHSRQPKVVMLLASDDPSMQREPDLSDALLAQQRIRLAAQEAAEKKTPNPRVLHRFEEEAQGWEGGFFSLMFWNLGANRKNTAEATAVPGDGRERTPAPSEETLKLRSFIGRAYMMDLAVLAGASDKVVCAVSAMGCRLLGVMMGWERAMEQGDWVNVDGEYGWSGLRW
ncbi:hypothetical protein HIM_07110 [Hirsutella minnesotensis 3608]|uniref:Uncharacterized protein n=1 Tax=Hirsutella minnesotensis 3608 TaxID=1043627 RepID=A0A0F8A4G8_9HYPO|nr:hypothetical protein HIM_07110 [Hirsutella minnesotensis 3608]